MKFTKVHKYDKWAYNNSASFYTYTCIKNLTQQKKVYPHQQWQKQKQQQ